MNNQHLFEVQKRRSDFLHLIRTFFRRKGYLEVDTPLVSPFLIPEPSIDIFETRYCNPYGEDSPAYLIPSPELWMKRLLGMGSPSLFQICKSFRNRENIGPYHNPEFTMLEWYSVDHDYLDNIKVLEELLLWLREGDSGALCAGFQYPKESLFPLKRISMAEAFKEIMGINLEANLSREGLFNLCREYQLLASEDEEWEVLFNKLFLTFVEPRFKEWGGVVLTDYPSGIVTLAREKGDGFSERWEFYLKGVEIANCFTEETNREKVRRTLKMESEFNQKAKGGCVDDLALADIFHENFPACSGVALGVDRLFCLMAGLSSVTESLAFPFTTIFGLESK